MRVTLTPIDQSLFSLSALERQTASTADPLPLKLADASIYIPPMAETRRLPLRLNRRTGALAGAAIATVAGTSLVQLANQPAQYEGKFQLLVEPGTVAPTQANAPSQSKALPAPSLDYATQIQVLWSPKLLAPVAQQLQTQYADLNYDTLAQKLTITHRDGTTTLDVTYHDTDPRKVQAVLAKVSQAYVQYSQECRTSLCRELNFVEKRLPQLQQQVKVAQHNLRAFQQQHHLAEPSVLGQALTYRSGVLMQQRQDLQIRLTEARTRSAILQKRLVGAVDGVQAAQLLAQNDRYQSLLGQFQSIATQLTAELARPQPDADALPLLKQRYQQLSEQLTQAAQQPIARQLAQAIAEFQAKDNADYSAVMRQESLLEWVTAASQVQALETSQQAIAQTETAINQQIKQWATLVRQYSELNLELKFATDNLNLYQTRRTELQQFVQPRMDWQLTAAPTVEAPTADRFALSDPERDVSVGLLLCFMLVVLVISVAEQTQASRVPRQLLKPAVQPEYSWQTLVVPEQPYTLSMQTIPALSDLSQRRKILNRTTLFLLIAVARIETMKRAPIAALAPVNNC